VVAIVVVVAAVVVAGVAVAVVVVVGIGVAVAVVVAIAVAVAVVVTVGVVVAIAVGIGVEVVVGIGIGIGVVVISPFGAHSVLRTAEFERVQKLPIVKPLVDVAYWTSRLRTSHGTQVLRPIQAMSFQAALECRGLFAPIRVGGGKTLISLLVSSVLGAKRPILLLPAGLLEKTMHDRAVLSEHWQLPTNLQMFSYEILGRVDAAERLGYVQPDLIIADECHRLKNAKAGVSRRVIRFMREHPETEFVGMSGTIMRSSISDFARILRWCLKTGAPVPSSDEECLQWAEALDEGVNPLTRRRPGPLVELAPGSDARDPLAAARQAFQRRLLATPGVVASPPGDGVTCSLYVRGLPYEVSPVTRRHLSQLRETWETPDGWQFSEALELRRYARELALGFHSVWDPRPLAEWLVARREWATFVRDTLSRSRTLDTELQVARWVDADDRRDPLGYLAAWRAVKESFVVHAKPVWHDNAALATCQRWLGKHPGIVWTEHVFFARRLAEISGVVYYGADGLSDRGESITYVTGKQSIVASVQANGTGRNLQMFSKNLITSFPSGAATVEQLLGRTHRDGQTADEVVVDVLLGDVVHTESFDRAMAGALAARDTLGHEQKLLLADVTL
jgi:hypothetical protein